MDGDPLDIRDGAGDDQRRQHSSFVNAVLRVPPVIAMDILIAGTLINFEDLGIENPALQYFVFIAGFAAALIIFLLTIRSLKSVYCLFVAAGALAASVWWNEVFLVQMDHHNLTSDWDSLALFSATNLGTESSPVAMLCSLDFILYVCMHAVYAYVFVSFGGKSYWLKSGNLGYHLFWFVLPVLMRFILMTIYDTEKEGVNEQIRHLVNVCRMTALFEPVINITISSLAKLFWLVLRLKSLVQSFVSIAKHFGITVFIEYQWQRLQVPTVLRIFCVTRLFLHILDFPNSVLSEAVEINYEMAMNVIDEIAAHGCDTIIAVLGISAILTPVANFMGRLARKFIGGHEEEPEHVGTMTSILFFILALQTGLPGLARTKRISRLYRNLSLLATAHLHFIHNILHPVLMQLSTSHVAPLQRHIRALIAATLLLILPGLCIWYWWSVLSISTWLLAVTAFCLELIVKVIVSLIVYILFLIDTFSDDMWEGLDDSVYYIKAVGSTFEFISGIFLFVNGFWILIFESGGIIRAAMMCIHAYFNIFQVGKDGWKKFRLRRLAVQKIKSLREATEQELSENNDVCAICYQEMNTARMTPCLHIFHAGCLRKWLYMQDSCPLCHQVVMEPEETRADGENEEGAMQEDAGPRLNHRGGILNFEQGNLVL